MKRRERGSEGKWTFKNKPILARILAAALKLHYERNIMLMLITLEIRTERPHTYREHFTWIMDNKSHTFALF